MKQLLITIAAVVMVGCGAKAPEISIHEAVGTGNIEAVKQHLAASTDVNALDEDGDTPLHIASLFLLVNQKTLLHMCNSHLEANHQFHDQLL